MRACPYQWSRRCANAHRRGAEPKRALWAMKRGGSVLSNEPAERQRKQATIAKLTERSETTGSSKRPPERVVFFLRAYGLERTNPAGCDTSTGRGGDLVPFNRAPCGEKARRKGASPLFC